LRQDEYFKQSISPGIKDAIEFNLELKPYTKFDLDNKVPLYMIHAGAEDVLQLELVFYSGNWYDRAKWGCGRN
jgi:hypothetical protein